MATRFELRNIGQGLRGAQRGSEGLRGAQRVSEGLREALRKPQKGSRFPETCLWPLHLFFLCGHEGHYRAAGKMLSQFEGQLGTRLWIAPPTKMDEEGIEHVVCSVGRVPCLI